MVSMRNILSKLGALFVMVSATTAHADTAKAMFAGGCFWCMESEFETIDGVSSVVSGYTGGAPEDASYDKVSAHKTAHVEAVEVTYDTSKVNYATLLDIYWGNIDPTDAGGQFYDRGEQYATVIYYQNEEEKQAAEQSKEAVAKKLGKPIATRIEPAGVFYPAEEYHQNYYKTNPEHYQGYVKGSGRKEKLKRIWGE